MIFDFRFWIEREEFITDKQIIQIILREDIEDMAKMAMPRRRWNQDRLYR
jgi:hypothetical protein